MRRPQISGRSLAVAAMLTIALLWQPTHAGFQSLVAFASCGGGGTGGGGGSTVSGWGSSFNPFDNGQLNLDSSNSGINGVYGEVSWGTKNSSGQVTGGGSYQIGAPDELFYGGSEDQFQNLFGANDSGAAFMKIIWYNPSGQQVGTSYGHYSNGCVK